MTETAKATGAPRKITIGSVTKQSSNRRITFPVQMKLTGELLGDLPDWVSDSFDVITHTAKKLTPEVQQVSDVLLMFTNDKPRASLFKTPDAKIPGAELKGFTVLRTGDPDQPEIELHFSVFAPFQREFWQWLGEMAGEEVWFNFPTSLLRQASRAEPGEQLPMETAIDGAPAGRPAAAAPSGGPKGLASAASPASSPKPN
jgi:hypothetical protein